MECIPCEVVKFQQHHSYPFCMLFSIFFFFPLVWRTVPPFCVTNRYFPFKCCRPLGSMRLQSQSGHEVKDELGHSAVLLQTLIQCCHGKAGVDNAHSCMVCLWSMFMHRCNVLYVVRHMIKTERWRLQSRSWLDRSRQRFMRSVLTANCVYWSTCIMKM